MCTRAIVWSFSLVLLFDITNAWSSPGYGSLVDRSLVAAGGWSLSIALGGSCPSGTASCFSNLTGVAEYSNRGEECCPYGTTPRLDCGTYVNTGQPYACCPLSNADCRGDVEASKESNLCANSGWALWYIPDGGYNRFCCLPDQYGYWYKSLGQDAVGQCSNSKELPSGSTPAVQESNGDESVDSSGSQVSALPTATPTPAPTCDIIHYGWSLQVSSDNACTEGSSLCSYGGACCPAGLNCGTVIGDSEVPVCCPPNNPDCRGDVEGLWPQVCADSSWAIWHVNTNGNHFCCLPGQIGYNVPFDNAAVGFCGSAVPNGTMRSILDYEGDGSKAGSFARFPCDSSPAPNASYPSIKSAILNPPSSLNPPAIPPATTLYSTANYAPSAIVKPWIMTSYVCPPGASQTLAIIKTLSNGIPVTMTSSLGVKPTSTATVYTTTWNGVVVTRTSTSSEAGAASLKNTATASLPNFTGDCSTIRSPSLLVRLVSVAAAALLFRRW